MSLPTSAAHGSGHDSNPLRRRSDSVERWGRWLAIGLFVLLTPAIGWFAGRMVYDTGSRIESGQRDGRYRVDAVLSQDATYPGSAGIVPSVLTMASWTTPDGATHNGWVRAKVGTPAGSRVPTWIGRDGMPTDEPRSHDETLAQTAATVILVPIGLFIVLGGAFWMLRAILDRRRLAQWQTEWLLIEPRWSGRHQGDPDTANEPPPPTEPGHTGPAEPGRPRQERRSRAHRRRGLEAGGGSDPGYPGRS